MELDLTHWLLIVPARLGSERLPEKPLQDLAGKPLIVRVCENLEPLVKHGATMVVATDADRVATACNAHGLQVEMTSPHHPSGTDRCQEVARRYTHPYIMNVQGDEPFISTADLLTLARAMNNGSDPDMGTLVFASRDKNDAANPNVVKGIRAASGYALYFSRCPIPYDRSGSDHLPLPFWHHMGVYAFRRERLEAFCNLPPSHLEKLEKLEQLRAVEAGWKILLVQAKTLSTGIDTPADLESARAKF